jgi:hypothetical protein
MIELKYIVLYLVSPFGISSTFDLSNAALKLLLLDDDFLTSLSSCGARDLTADGNITGVGLKVSDS